MNTETLKIGCQTFTWEMLGDKRSPGPDALLLAIAEGGYQGIEITDTMIGHYAARPDDFALALQSNGLELAAFAFGSSSGFTQRERLEEDMDTAARWLEFTAHFPGVPVSLGSATVMSAGPRDDMFDIAAELYNRVGSLGTDAGVPVAIHPSSHRDTLLFDRDDYDRLFARLDTGTVGWVPDTGHILRGGHDLLDTMRSYQERIHYIHLKDVDASDDWAMLGTGRCDLAAVIELARRAPRFNGWIVVEEESAQAAADPARAVRVNRDRLSSMGY